MGAFMYTWDKDWRRYEADGMEGKPLDHVTSNRFSRVRPGDTIYVVINRDQRIGLVGRLDVTEVIDLDEAFRRFPDDDVPEMTYHAITDHPDSMISFNRIVPERIARSLISVTDKPVRFESDSFYRIGPMALRSPRWLTATSAQLLDAVLDDHATAALDPRGGQGRRLSQAAKHAVERRAMDVVTNHYASLGWTVEDVSAYESYDLRISSVTTEKHVEVKGTITGGETVELTAAETAQASNDSFISALAIVSEIELVDRNRRPRATGGDLALWDPWTIEDGTLIPTRYRYLPPTVGQVDLQA